MIRRDAEMTLMNRVVVAMVGTLTLATPAFAQRTPERRPDLQGFWTNGTATPFQRPADFANKQVFTPVEAAEYEQTALERLVKSFPEQDRNAADLNDTYLDTHGLKVIDLRTSLIIDPADGKLPPLLPAAQ